MLIFSLLFLLLQQQREKPAKHINIPAIQRHLMLQRESSTMSLLQLYQEIKFYQREHRTMIFR